VNITARRIYKKRKAEKRNTNAEKQRSKKGEKKNPRINARERKMMERGNRRANTGVKPPNGQENPMNVKQTLFILGSVLWADLWLYMPPDCTAMSLPIELSPR
jgi:hypothetical protein